MLYVKHKIAQVKWNIAVSENKSYVYWQTCTDNSLLVIRLNYKKNPVWLSFSNGWIKREKHDSEQPYEYSQSYRYDRAEKHFI